MSKYNLIDIFEQYQIGSGWTTDFDYDGMLKAGLKAGVDTDIKVLKKISDDFEDVNYHRENNHLQNAIEAMEEGATKEASMFFGDFQAEIKNTMKEFGMDIEPTLGKFMDAKMDLDEDKASVDLAIEASQEKAGIKEDKEMDEIAGYDRKGNKQEDSDGSDASKYKRAAMNKEDLQETIGNAKAKIDEGSYPFDQCLSDNEGKYGKKGAAKVCGYIKAQYGEGIVKEEEFSGEDEMQMHLKQYRDGNIDGDDLFQAFDEIINGSVSSPRKRGFNLKYGMEEADAVNFDMKVDADYDEGLKDIEEDSISGEDDYAEELSDKMRMKEALPKFKGVPPMRDIIKALKDDAKATDSEIKQFMASVKKAGDEFDDVDDYVEDFKNYVADKALQEHFGRFMKDYQ